MSRLYLIRHGKTVANEKHLYCGSTDLPLSKVGIAELQKLSYHIPEAKFYTSGMKRTNETLQILFGDVPYEVLPEFREIDFGIFEMKSYQELKDDPQYLTWITGDNESNIPPEGESGKQLQSRVIAGFDCLPKDSAVLVTHGGVIAVLMEWLFPGEGKNRYEWQPAPGNGYLIQDGQYKKIP